MHAVPYWRLSGFYFSHFALMGAFVPYWSLYLQSISFTAFQIGVLTSLLQGMRVFAPAAWGWLSDHTGKRLAIVQLASVGGLLSYCAVFLDTSFGWLFASMSLMSFFWSASLPLMEATTLSYLREGVTHYGRIRVWGSLGFICSVATMGYLLDGFGIISLLWALLGFNVGIMIFTRLIPEVQTSAHATASVPIGEIFRRPEVMSFFAACMLMALAHGPYYAFYSIYLVEHSYSKSTIGWLWAIGVISEVGIFFLMPQLVRRFQLKQIMMFSFACAVARFLMIGWGVGSPSIVVAAQVLHAATYGSHHATAMLLVHRFFPGPHQAKGQALYISLTFGLGGALGGLLSGYTWEPLGPGLTFTMSATAVLLGLLLIIRNMQVDHPRGGR